MFGCDEDLSHVVFEKMRSDRQVEKHVTGEAQILKSFCERSLMRCETDDSLFGQQRSCDRALRLRRYNARFGMTEQHKWTNIYFKQPAVRIQTKYNLSDGHSSSCKR